MSAETAAILDRAADVIERNGWHQGYYYNGAAGLAAANCPVCVFGAINVAAFGEPSVSAATPAANSRRAGDASDAVRAHLGLETVADWNDDPERTAEQVIAALRRAAQAERDAGS